jgi:hypothetical protein
LPSGCLGALPALAQTGRLGVELNKMEPADGGGCRVFFLFRNATGETFERFEIVAWRCSTAKGVIDRLLTIDASPLPPARTTLKLFEVPGLACEAVSEVLLHDVPACTIANRPDTDCFALIDLGSKAPAALVQ